MQRPPAESPVTLVIVALLLLSFSLQSCEPASATSTPKPPTTASPTVMQQPTTASTPASLGKRTKTSGCVASKSLPDAACTPGAVFPNVTGGDVCTPGYSSKVRDVPQSVKDKVYTEYGINSHEPGQYEVDHLVSLELGGSNGIANLWPEPADPRPGFHEKDKVENYLHDQVCSGTISLQQAQVKIGTDWIGVYHTLP